MPSPQRSRADTIGSLLQEVPGAFITDDPEGWYGVAPQPTFRTLSEAARARRAEYIRSKQIRIKIGTWNVAAHKSADKDLGGWFVQSKGMVDKLADLSLQNLNGLSEAALLNVPNHHELEDVGVQEVRQTSGQSTLPQDDHGSVMLANEAIDIYVLGLQEVVDINSATEALRPYTDPSVAKKWKDATEVALPKGYKLAAEHQLLGLLLLIYASTEMTEDIRFVSTTGVGTGLMGYMGNKGAASALLVLGESTKLVFVDSHLAAGNDKTALERRKWDVQQIVQRTKFEPLKDDLDSTVTRGLQIGDEDYIFWFGDLNYRLEGVPGPDVRRLFMIHSQKLCDTDQSPTTANALDGQRTSFYTRVRDSTRFSTDSASSARTTSTLDSDADTDTDTITTAASTINIEYNDDYNPLSLQATISSLLPHDELLQQMKGGGGTVFHDGWREGPITFLPTYKYDVGSVGVFDSSEKRRGPSWCDRILFRTRNDREAFENRMREEASAKRREEEMKASGSYEADNDEAILYDYDPETDGTYAYNDYDEYNDDDTTGAYGAQEHEHLDDRLQLEYYTSHQRVLSSDHKPLEAVFKLEYDSIVPELKAKVQAEAAKEFDKNENDRRPDVTVVADQYDGARQDPSPVSPDGFSGVWFGGVRWAQTKQRSMTIANTGRVIASYRFLDHNIGIGGAAAIAPAWLRLDVENDGSVTEISPASHFELRPGDTANVRLTLRVTDLVFVQALNEGNKNLEAILVLRVDGARDYFIQVQADWLETSLARSIDQLVRIPEGGIRKLQSLKRDRKGKKNINVDKHKDTDNDLAMTEAEPIRFSAPRELFRLTDAIESLAIRTIAELDMVAGDNTGEFPWTVHPTWPFIETSWSENSSEVWQEALSDACNALDTDEPLEANISSDMPMVQRLYVLATLLLLFLQSIPGGLINEALWTQVENYFSEIDALKRRPGVEEQRTALQEILSQSPSHNISFLLVMTMLEHLRSEITSLNKPGKSQMTSPVSPTSSKRNPLARMKALGRQSADLANTDSFDALSKLFANILISEQSSSGSNKGLQSKRKSEFIRLFLEGG